MADAKISDLTSKATPAVTDEVEILDRAGGGKVSKRVTIQKIVDKAPSGAFTPTTGGDWSGPPAAIQAAFDELAARLAVLEASPGGGGEILKAIVTLDNDDIIALPTTFVEIIPAPGSGKSLMFLMARAVLDPRGGIYGNVTGNETIGFIYGDTGDASTYGFLYNLEDDSMKFVSDMLKPAVQTSGVEIAGYDNKPLKLGVAGAAGNFSGGDAANTLTLTVFYTIVDL